MSDKTIAQRLVLKPGYTMLLLNEPPGYRAVMGELPQDVRIVTESAGPVEMIQVFVADYAEMERELPRLKPMLKDNGILWLTYRKGTSKPKTDINRDTIWRYARTIGMDAVAMFSIDDDWSAMRLKVV